MTTFTARDVPMLRRELAAWYGSDSGVTFYHQMIALGRQPIRASGASDQFAAQMLAADEAHRLTNADLWFINADLCTLIDAAHASMPPFNPQPSDLPSRVAFVLFAEPFALRPAGVDAEMTAKLFPEPFATDTERRAREHLITGDVEIYAATWGPCRYRLDTQGRHNGGVFMSFYSRTRSRDAVDDPKIRARIDLPTLIVDNEAVVPWVDADRPGPALLDPAMDGQSTYGWARLLFAAFLLARQAGLADEVTERTARPERRRTQRAGLPERDVHVVRLRHTEHEASSIPAGGREYQHRWVVRGHWRNAWRPSVQAHRPVWVHSHVKGPDGAPLIGGERVTVVGPPAPPA